MLMLIMQPAGVSHGEREDDLIRTAERLDKVSAYRIRKSSDGLPNLEPTGTGVESNEADDTAAHFTARAY